MTTGVDVVLEDKQAQEFWLRRLIAFIIDSVIIYVPIEIISAYAWSIGYYNQATWLLAGFLLVAYSALFETELGYTIGKRIMDLEVISLDLRPYDMKRGLQRNITKIHPALVVIDLLGGLLQEGRSNMRYIDIVIDTEVVDTEVARWRRDQGFSPPPVGDRPEPSVTVQTEGAPVPTMPPAVSTPEPPAPPPEDALMEVPEDTGEDAEVRDIGIPPPPVPEGAPPVTAEVIVEEEYEEVAPPGEDDDGDG
jgi:uncharacterized RDD family membrane protein YckC